MDVGMHENHTEEARHLTTLPAEILHHIFSWIEPGDLVRVARVCRLFYDCIKGNQALCRAIYLLRLDTPRAKDLDWEKEVYDFAKLCHILRPNHDYTKEAHQLAFVSETVSRLLEHASHDNNRQEDEVDAAMALTSAASLNAEHLQRLFRTELSATAFFQGSGLFERMRTNGFVSSTTTRQRGTREEYQQSAKLHCLCGVPIQRAGRTRATRTYPYACSKVYDLREYTALTRWGPFRDDDTGRVDWEKVEAINIVINKNVSTLWPASPMFSDLWETPFWGSFPHSFVATKPPELSDLDAQDPYGITGSWYRIVCFLDYSDFFHYNFSMEELVPGNAPRPPLNVGEATRLIIMKLHVTSIEPPGPDDGQALPVVHFAGESRAIDNSFDDNANSGIRGSVSLTKEGEVRWTSISVYQGQERWRSEGVQVGGARSARGVVGNWFDRDYDVHGPAGPTMFWKAADSEDPQGALLGDMQGVLRQHSWPEGVLAILDEVADGDIDWSEREEEDDDDDWDLDLDPVENELPGLLQDAETELIVITHHTMEDS